MNSQFNSSILLFVISQSSSLTTDELITKKFIVNLSIIVNIEHCNKIYCFIEHIFIYFQTTPVQQSTHMNRLIIKNSNCNTIAAIKNSMQ